MIYSGSGVAVPCGGSPEGPSGFLTSPGYPMRVEEQVNCDWVIHVAVGGTIQLRVQVRDHVMTPEYYAPFFC